MFTDIQLLQIKNTVMKILHIPGGYTGGVLEMAVVADYHISGQELTDSCMQIANTLRKQEETFRNVRLNLIKWIGDDCIGKEISSFSALQLGRAFADHGQQIPGQDKSLDELFRQLKLFYARSKVIILLTDGSYRIEDKKAVQGYLQPFLGRKLLVLQQGEQIQGMALSRQLLKETEPEGDILDAR